MERVVKFVLPLQAQPRGSKFTVNGRIIDTNPKSKPFMAAVNLLARNHMAGRKPVVGPLCLTVTICRTRPKHHYDRKGLVKASAPPWPTTKPDLSKMLRGIEDAMSKVVYVDDSQICREVTQKEWAGPNEFASVAITVETLP